MEDLTRFDDICPFSDDEAVKALSYVAHHPAVPVISKLLFPDEKPSYLSSLLKNVYSVDEFQQIIMSKAVDWCIQNTMSGFSYDGIENLKAADKKYLMMSNHRDIILDPALTQFVLYENSLPLSEICVGDNLLSSKTVEYLLRSNRMIKVIRGISARELYLSSQILSQYIRETVTSGKSSVWIAQRQGRTKDGADITEQGLLKMFDMSGKGTFSENFKEINIVPLSISYQYEPCDIRKARELLISRSRKYVKRPREDMHSIVIGIRQYKGGVHLNIGKPLAPEEIELASHCDKNDRYQYIRDTVSKRIIDGYKLWDTNYIAYDIVNRTSKYADMYDKADIEKFETYIDRKLTKVERSLDKAELKDILLHIYANPVISKEKHYG